MNKYVIIGVVLFLLVGGFFLFSGGSSGTGNVVKTASDRPVKEFTMESYYDNTGIWFSLKEIGVNKGDLVRIKITNIKGMHDFKIDELGVYSETPLNQETVVEFVADKAGEFIYYCAKPGHRQKGQWGTLKVIG